MYDYLIHPNCKRGLFLVPVGTLLAVFSLLAGRPAAVRSGDILFLLGLGFHLAAVVIVLLPCRTEHYSAASNYVVDVCHILKGKKVKR